MLSYETIFSRVRGRRDDPKELSLDKSDLVELYTERLHNVAGDPRIRRLFSTISFNDEIQMLSYTLNNSVDAQSDDDFVVRLFVTGMIIEWLQPQVNSVLYTAPFIGGKEEKKILDGHNNMIKRLESMKVELQKLIRDYGTINNSYIAGES